jgi:quaternary ammonium compound-resistance protein SugE
LTTSGILSIVEAIFNEKLSVPQVVCVILIVIGIAGLKILGKE